MNVWKKKFGLRAGNSEFLVGACAGLAWPLGFVWLVGMVGWFMGRTTAP